MDAYKIYLTDLAKDISNLIGFDATFCLLKHYGGRTLRIGKTPGSKTQERIAHLIGDEAARRLGYYFNGVAITVPICAKLHKAIRNDKVRAEFDRLTVQEKLSSRAAVAHIAINSNPPLHERTIWRVLNKASG